MSNRPKHSDAERIVKTFQDAGVSNVKTYANSTTCLSVRGVVGEFTLVYRDNGYEKSLVVNSYGQSYMSIPEAGLTNLLHSLQKVVKFFS